MSANDVMVRNIDVTVANKENDGVVRMSIGNSSTPAKRRPAPRGWSEAVHKESGTTYYYNKKTRQSTFMYPAGEQVGDDDTLLGRTLSMLSGKKKDTTSSTQASNAETEKQEKQEKMTISFSALITEVKLCVRSDVYDALDALRDELHSGAISGEQAVQRLEQAVGPNVAQEASLSVKSHEAGKLPHGWLEFTTGAGMPYYYNVHTKTTTWYRPTAPVPPPPRTPPPPGPRPLAEREAASEASDAGVLTSVQIVEIDMPMQRHRQIMSSSI